MLTKWQRENAKFRAERAAKASAKGDNQMAEIYVMHLYEEVGYRANGPTEEAQKIRMPAGRAVPWSRRWEAVKAWANT